MGSVAVVLDTSVVLNLLATGVGRAILESLELDCFVCSAVVDETIYIRSDDPTRPPEVASIDPWILSGAVKVISPDSPLEEAIYVLFAADLDDGEAMSLAICRARGYALATDDRKARRIAGHLALPGVDLLSTSQILHYWGSRLARTP
jgi:predicted nucleic acid-binding protein